MTSDEQKARKVRAELLREAAGAVRQHGWDTVMNPFPTSAPGPDEQKAREIVNAMFMGDADFMPTLVGTIASALREARREERERCAEAVKTAACGCGSRHCEREVAIGAAASAIRALEDK